MSLLTKIFKFVFDTGIIPSVWKLAIIKPIPKNALLDPRIPLNYRGISLQSTVYKLFSSLLNSRLMTFLEDNRIYADEQNGFRRYRSCLDHIFTLTSIIRYKKHKRNQPSLHMLIWKRLLTELTETCYFIS